MNNNNNNIIIQNFPNIDYVEPVNNNYIESVNNNNYIELLTPLIKRKFKRINPKIIYKFNFNYKGKKIKKIVI